MDKISTINCLFIILYNNYELTLIKTQEKTPKFNFAKLLSKFSAVHLSETHTHTLARDTHNTLAKTHTTHSAPKKGRNILNQIIPQYMNFLYEKSFLKQSESIRMFVVKLIFY